MTLNARIKAALDPLGFPVRAEFYTGREESFITFQVATAGSLFANDGPAFEEAWVQVHLFCPYHFDYTDTVERVKRLLFAGGFTWPEVVNATGDRGSALKEGRHFVFECQGAEGVDLDGET